MTHDEMMSRLRRAEQIVIDENWDDDSGAARDLVLKAMESEREQCAKELDDKGEIIYRIAAKLLREGGGKNE